MTPEFAVALSMAYGREYNMPSIVVFTGSFVWSKKVTFYDPASQRRYTYKIGNFVRLRTGGGILRIDQITVHTFEGRQRLFVMGTPLPPVAGTEDPMLGRGYRRIVLTTTPKPTLFGLPSISAEHMYVVPVRGNGDAVSLATGDEVLTSTDFIWSQYTLQWL